MTYLSGVLPGARDPAGLHAVYEVAQRAPSHTGVLRLMFAVVFTQLSTSLTAVAPLMSGKITPRQLTSHPKCHRPLVPGLTSNAIPT